MNAFLFRRWLLVFLFTPLYGYVQSLNPLDFPDILWQYVTLSLLCFIIKYRSVKIDSVKKHEFILLYYGTIPTLNLEFVTIFSHGLVLLVYARVRKRTLDALDLLHILLQYGTLLLPNVFYHQISDCKHILISWY